MELLHRAFCASGRRMQWVCGAEVVDEALAAAAGPARDGIACERRWRQGRCDEVGSRFERLMAPTRGPILAITRQPRELPEMLRAFVPAGRRYLSLSGADVDALIETARRLDGETDIEWARLSVS